MKVPLITLKIIYTHVCYSLGDWRAEPIRSDMQARPRRSKTHDERKRKGAGSEESPG